MTDNKLDFYSIIENFSDNPALIWPDGELTYHQYFQQINFVTERFIKKGVKSGNRVAVLTDIDHHFPIIFFAIIKLGGIVLPINPKFPEKKINEILRQIECDFLITAESSFTVEPESHIKVLDDIFDIEIPLDGKNLERNILFFLNQTATIILTSGSGGFPKAVLHNVGNHYYSALGSNENIPLNSGDCWMVSLPFFHIAGIAILFRTLIAGAACYFPDKNQFFQDQINKVKVTHLSLVSTQLYRWLKDKNFPTSRASIKAVLVGGSQIPQSLIEHALKINLPVYASYGSTEMSSQITTTTIEELKLNPRSSGRPLSYRELKIDDTGEILAKGRTLCEGYISVEDVLPCTDDGWFHTGDLGYVDENQNLIVKGRQDNMFISGGENIYPEEIEQHLKFHDTIIDVCVVDVPDVEYGARPVAFVKLEGNETVIETDLKEYLRDEIAAFQIPVRFFPWPEDVDGLKPDRRYFRELAIKITIFPEGE